MKAVLTSFIIAVFAILLYDAVNNVNTSINTGMFRIDNLFDYQNEVIIYEIDFINSKDCEITFANIGSDIVIHSEKWNYVRDHNKILFYNNNPLFNWYVEIVELGYKQITINYQDNILKLKYYEE